MKKQTVQDIYDDAQRIKRQSPPPTNQASQEPILLLKNIANAIQQAQQSVSQAELGQTEQLKMAHQRLQHAEAQLQTFQTTAPKVLLEFSSNIQKDFTQLHQHITAASHTVDQMQKSLGTH